LETALEAVAFAEEFAFGGEAGTLRIADFEVEFSAEALGAGGMAAASRNRLASRDKRETRVWKRLVFIAKKSMRYLAFRVGLRERG